MIKGIFFDLDYTLFDEREYVFSAFKEVAEYLAKEYQLEAETIEAKFKGSFLKKGRGHNFDGVIEKYQISRGIISTMVKIYRNHQPKKLVLYPDAMELLEKIQGKYHLGIITDGQQEVQRSKVQALQLERWFSKILITDEQGQEYWKPHHYSYQQLISTFQLKPNETIYIGDNPEKDFVTARKMGMWTVRLIRHGDWKDLRLSPEYEADFEVTNLLEILDLIPIMEGGKNHE